MSKSSRGVFKSTKSAMIFLAVFFAFIIVMIIITEIDMADWVYGEPYEMQGVVVKKEKDRKMSSMDSNGIHKSKSDSSNYTYYVYVELENEEEIRLRCSDNTEYEKYAKGQQVTIVCSDVTEDGEFSHVSYSFKEE